MSLSNFRCLHQASTSNDDDSVDSVEGPEPLDESTASEDDDRKRPAVSATKPPPSVASCVGENETRATLTRESKNVGHSITPSPRNRPAVFPPPAVVSNTAVPPPAVVSNAAIPPPVDVCSALREQNERIEHTRACIKATRAKYKRPEVIDLCDSPKKEIIDLCGSPVKKKRKEIGEYGSDENNDYLD